MTEAEKMELFIRLRAQGVSYNKISAEIGVSKPTLIKWAREFEAEVSNRRSMEMEELAEKYHLQKAQKMQTYGKHLESIRAELESRLEDGALEELPTRELFKLFIDYMDRLEEMREPLTLTVNENPMDQLDTFMERTTFNPS